ncbi:unnamed protein product, partial [Iphiclides podalirius]
MIITNEKEFDIFVASRIGSFKHIKYHRDPLKNSKKCIENLVEVKSLQKDDTITSMVWGNVDQTEIIIGRRNQQIQVYNTQKAEFTKSYTADFGAGDVVGLGRHQRKFLAAVASGVVRIWSKKEEATVEVGGKIDTMRVCGEDSSLFATGGEENDLKVWRIGESSAQFVAKNLPLDWLQLRPPVWVSGLVFLPGSGGRELAVCSRHGYVRLYDTRAQRRPVCNVTFPKMAATCIETSFDERQVLVGFGRGQLQQVDLRRGRPDKGFKGCVGAVTSVAVHRPLRLLVTTSLDRHLRVHGFDTKEMLHKQYLTSKLSAALVQTECSTPLLNAPEADVKEELEEEAVEVDEMDELFEQMETVGEKPRKKQAEEQPQVPDDAKRMKPSTEGSTDADLDEGAEEEEDKIMRLLKSTERQKRRLEKRRKEKKARSVFHNA